MSNRTVTHRQVNLPAPVPDLGAGMQGQPSQGEHPAGEIKHGGSAQTWRIISFAIYILLCSCTIFATQIIGVPLYWINRDMYYAYMAVTKQSYGLVITTMTKWWTPTVIRVSGDASVAGQIRKTEDGRLECHFPDRLVLVANHQLYTDWLYLWWIAYTNVPQVHGHIYIIAKESLKWLPIVGWAMQFYGFIFMSRKFVKDQPRMAHRLKQLKGRHPVPISGSVGLDPMWLMLFPEGTNASDNGRKKSAAWAQKIGVKDTEHVLLPRSTGSFFCLNELKGSLGYVYDCTVAYEGVRRGEFGQDYFTFTSSLFQGRPPKSVNMYWRRFSIVDIPLGDQSEFDSWIRARWYEKDALIEQYMVTGRFPGFDHQDDASHTAVTDGFIEIEVKTKHHWEVLSIFAVPGIIVLLWIMIKRFL